MKKLPYMAAAFFSLLILAGSAFSKKNNSFNIERFGQLPVLHNGRYKPLDTIGRVSLMSLRNKQSVQKEGIKIGGAEWLLETIARPEAANELEVFLIHDPDILSLLGETGHKKHFSYKQLEPFWDVIFFQAGKAERIEGKLRSRFQKAIVQLNSKLLMYFKIQGSFRPGGSDDFESEFTSYRTALDQGIETFLTHMRSGSTPGKNKKFDDLLLFIQRYQKLADTSYVKELPPLPGEPPEAWTNLGENLLNPLRMREWHPFIQFYPRLIEAYQSQNAQVFNELMGNYFTHLNHSIPSVVKKVSYEALFNKLQLFYNGMIFYLLAFVLVCFSWLKWEGGLRKAAYGFFVSGLIVHSLGLIARMWIQGRPPVTNLYSSALFVGWGGVMLSVYLEKLHKRGIATAVGSVIGFCSLIIAHHLSVTGDTLEMMQAVLDSNFWLATHVVVITIGYSSTFLAGALAMFYIFKRLFNKLGTAESTALYQMTYGIICFSLLFSFVGTVLGGIWADQSWGRFWGWDPKENGALLIVLWNSMILHARMGGYVRDRGFMVMAVFGTIITSFSWFGVNMLGIGLHSYGFMDKAFFWLLLFIAIQLVIMSLAFIPRRLKK